MLRIGGCLGRIEDWKRFFDWEGSCRAQGGLR